MVARKAHNLEVTGSSPVPAIFHVITMINNMIYNIYTGYSAVW